MCACVLGVLVRASPVTLKLSSIVCLLGTMCMPSGPRLWRMISR